MYVPLKEKYDVGYFIGQNVYVSLMEQLHVRRLPSGCTSAEWCGVIRNSPGDPIEIIPIYWFRRTGKKSRWNSEIMSGANARGIAPPWNPVCSFALVRDARERIMRNVSRYSQLMRIRNRAPLKNVNTATRHSARTDQTRATNIANEPCRISHRLIQITGPQLYIYLSQ